MKPFTSVTSPRTLVALASLLIGTVALAGDHGDVGVEKIAKAMVIGTQAPAPQRTDGTGR